VLIPAPVEHMFAHGRVGCEPTRALVTISRPTDKKRLAPGPGRRKTGAHDAR